jgi:excisionase family DNA binding protein
MIAEGALGEPLLTPEQVAEHLAVSKDVVYDLVQQGRLQGVRLNARTLRFTAEQVAGYIAERTTELREPRLSDQLTPRRARSRVRRSA